MIAYPTFTGANNLSVWLHNENMRMWLLTKYLWRHVVFTFSCIIKIFRLTNCKFNRIFDICSGLIAAYSKFGGSQKKFIYLRVENLFILLYTRNLLAHKLWISLHIRHFAVVQKFVNLVACAKFEGTDEGFVTYPNFAGTQKSTFDCTTDIYRNLKIC